MDEAEKNTLVQQRIKKMLENKRKNLNRESSELTKRLKSHVGDKQISAEQQQDGPKPNSTLRLRRPVSAMKPVQSSNTIPLNYPNKQEIDVHPLIDSAFDHGVGLKQFFRQKKLNKQQWSLHIKQQLFLLRLPTILRKYPEETWHQLVQSECLKRISHIIERQKLISRCEQSQRRLGQMIESRIKQLSRH